VSRRPAFLGLALLASALAAVVALELDAAQPAEDQTGIVPIHHLPHAKARAPSEDPEDHTDMWVSAALARPLFSRDRRPTPEAAKGSGGPALAALPRLTGVVIGPFGRTAIFAVGEAGKAVAVGEGKTLGAYTVRAVVPGRVTVAGPEGERVVQLAPDAATRNTLAAELPQPAPVAAPPPAIPGLPPGVVPGQPLTPQQRATLMNMRGAAFGRGIPTQRPQATQEGSD
jgi:hypothetical protein